LIESIRKELEEVLREVVDYTIAHSGEVPVSSRKVLRICGEGSNRSIDESEDAERNYARLLRTEAPYLRDFPSLKALLDRIGANPAVSQALRLGKGGHEVADEVFICYLAPLADHLLRGLERGERREEVVASSLNALDEFVSKDTLEVRYSAPLWNVRSKLSELGIPDTVAVRCISKDQLQSYLNSLSRAKARIELLSYLPLEFQLEKVREEPRKTCWAHSGGRGIQNLFGSVVKAMRLAKHGAVGIAFIHEESPGIFGPGSSGLFLPATITVGESYELCEGDADVLVRILSQLSSLEGNARFSLALRRFMGAYDERSSDDKLIDYWIALESLLLPGGDQGELQFRAALRAAWLTAEPADRERVFRQARDSYKARSTLVHGEKEPDTSPILGETEELLRRTLRRFLELGRCPSWQELDALVLGLPPPNVGA
jgi:hypothetical protein